MVCGACYLVMSYMSCACYHIIYRRRRRDRFLGRFADRIRLDDPIFDIRSILRRGETLSLAPRPRNRYLCHRPFVFVFEFEVAFCSPLGCDRFGRSGNISCVHSVIAHCQCSEDSLGIDVLFVDRGNILCRFHGSLFVSADGLLIGGFVMFFGIDMQSLEEGEVAG